MTLPEAHIGHQTAERVRIKIPSQLGDEAYFSRVEECLLKGGALGAVQVNPRTGSVLITGSRTDLKRITALGEKNALFKLQDSAPKVESLSQKIAAPIRNLGRSIDRFSGGELDLSGAVFLGLIGWGVTELVRGNFAAPPWYVAFWYALGIFTKSLSGKTE
ncbi:MAG: hypothetical protein LJE96_06910 [Deltaproteobacteria bacterium]|jgi:hypothetical protein|nr:hypothetical protein [Deltaproteobacteria bacterium]